jgi:hypothetical protein
MKFISKEYTGLSVYVPDHEATEWYTICTEWIDEATEIEVDFEYVVEPVFILDVLNGIFSPIDKEAIQYQNQVYNDHAA